MKNRKYIFVGIGLLFIGFFMYRNASYMEENKQDYPSNSTVKESSRNDSNQLDDSVEKVRVEGFPVPLKIDEFPNKMPDDYKDNPIVYQKFHSSNYDAYKGMDLLSNVRERTFHTFDFANLIVTMNVPLNSGNFQKFEYKIEVVKRDTKGLVECNVVNNPTINKIFISSVSGVITYEFTNNYSLEFYDISKISGN